MSAKEVNAILESNFEEYKEAWEICRYTAFIIAVSAGAKLEKPENLLKFSWDAKEISLSNFEIIERSKEILKWATF